MLIIQKISMKQQILISTFATMLGIRIQKYLTYVEYVVGTEGWCTVPFIRSIRSLNGERCWRILFELFLTSSLDYIAVMLDNVRYLRIFYIHGILDIGHVASCDSSFHCQIFLIFSVLMTVDWIELRILWNKELKLY